MDEGKARRFSTLAGLALLGILLCAIWLGSSSDVRKQIEAGVSSAVKSATTTVEEKDPGRYDVVNFVDGDTITVGMDGRRETIRLIGVDTPETHDPRKSVQCFGEQAAAFTERLIGSDRVRLEADPTNSNRDKYGRLLRYVYLTDGRLVNKEIIAQGYGFAYVLFPFEKHDEFVEAETAAKATASGLWGGCSVTQNGQAKRTNDAE